MVLQPLVDDLELGELVQLPRLSVDEHGEAGEGQALQAARRARHRLPMLVHEADACGTYRVAFVLERQLVRLAHIARRERGDNEACECATQPFVAHLQHVGQHPHGEQVVDVLCLLAIVLAGHVESTGVQEDEKSAEGACALAAFVRHWKRESPRRRRVNGAPLGK